MPATGLSPSTQSNHSQITTKGWGNLASFRAMANPCELLIASHNADIAKQMLQLAMVETDRIEQKYSRFIEGNLLWQLNHSKGKQCNIDNETFQLLTFAQQCYQLSDHRFDISAGPLMQLWRFDGHNQLPQHSEISKAKQRVDFSQLTFSAQHCHLPTAMSLDLGGIGKEYAADRVATLLTAQWPDVSVLVNFGGDIACPISKKGTPWQIGIENPNQLDHAASYLTIRQGALATSGDTRRFIQHNGSRYGHIIDPTTGYPVEKAPRSVTVLAPNCVTAGMLATMAMLQGEHAEAFLAEQAIEFKIFR